MNKKKILIISSSLIFVVLAILFFSNELELTGCSKTVLPNGDSSITCILITEEKENSQDACELLGGIMLDDVPCRENDICVDGTTSECFLPVQKVLD